MAGYIETFTESGINLAAMLRNQSKQAWNTSLVAWQNWNPSNWADYALTMTEDTSSGFYTVQVPAAISAQRLSILIYKLAGGSPAVGDEPYGSSTGLYDGTQWESGWSTTARTITTLTGTAGCDVQLINGSATAAARLAISANTMITGTATTGTLSVSQMTTNLTQATSSILIGRVVFFTSGALTDQVGAIAGYDGSTKKITFFRSLVAAPSNGDTFVIV